MSVGIGRAKSVDLFIGVGVELCASEGVIGLIARVSVGLPIAGSPAIGVIPIVVVDDRQPVARAIVKLVTKRI